MSTIGSLMDGYYDFWNGLLYGKITYISGLLHLTR